jgi:hypothetical protein
MSEPFLFLRPEKAGYWAWQYATSAALLIRARPISIRLCEGRSSPHWRIPKRFKIDACKFKQAY